MASDKASKRYDVPKVHVNGKKKQHAYPDNEVSRKFPRIGVKLSPTKPSFDEAIKDVVDVSLVKQNEVTPLLKLLI